MPEYRRATRSFTLAHQLTFAELTGDRNPVHVDPAAARRLLFGAPVVHGLHLILWALEEWARGLEEPARLRRLECTFTSPLLLDMPAQLAVATSAESAADFDVKCGEATSAIGRFAWEREQNATGEPPAAPRWDCSPRQRLFEELASCQGNIPLGLDAPALSALFPASAARLPLRQLETLLAMTRLVGMECPGLHSVFSALKLQFDESEAARDASLHYRTVQPDDRFKRLVLEVSTAAAHGALTVFVRPGPHPQPGFAEVRARVDARDPGGRRVLVLGGSRGLGEVAAKIAAARGAEVCLTYATGREEAETVAGDINDNGGTARVAHYDVAAAPELAESLERGGFLPTHVYYLATPPLYVPRTLPFSEAAYQRFALFYVTGFANLAMALRKSLATPLTFFYPSTTALDAPVTGMAEYTAAKAAGEQLCLHLSRALRDTKFVVPRLPRLRTDLTATLQLVNAEEPLDCLLRVLPR